MEGPRGLLQERPAGRRFALRWGRCRAGASGRNPSRSTITPPLHLRVWDPGQAPETDLDRFFALDQSCFAPGVAYTREELSTFLTHPSAFCVLLEDGAPHASPRGELLGFAIARTFRSRGKPVFHIITIDVAPSARRRGIGTLLMDWMAAKGCELHMQALRLEVAIDNADAIHFYTRFGFLQVGRIAGYYLGTIDALVLERDLAQRGMVKRDVAP